MIDILGYLGQGLFMFFAVLAAYEAVKYQKTLPFKPAIGFTAASILNFVYAANITSGPLMLGMACNTICWALCSWVAYVREN